MINYIKNELIYKKLVQKLIIFILLDYILIKLNIYYFDSINSKSENFYYLFYKINNNLSAYLLPIIMYYMCFIKNFIIDLDFNYSYIYKFRSKLSWIKSKLIILLITTSIFIFISYLVFFLIGIVNYNLNLSYFSDIRLVNNSILNLIINFILIYFSQVLTLYIYSLICLFILLFTYNYKSIYLLLTQVILTTLILLNLLVPSNIIMNLSLIKFITPMNMILYGHGIFNGCMFLCLITYFLIFIIKFKLKYYELYLLNNKI